MIGKLLRKKSIAAVAVILCCWDARADQPEVHWYSSLFLQSGISPALDVLERNPQRPFWIDGFSISIMTPHSAPASAGENRGSAALPQVSPHEPAVESLFGSSGFDKSEGLATFGKGYFAVEIERKFELKTIDDKIPLADIESAKRQRKSVPFLGLSINAPLP